jgi:hypothetical protein
MSKRATCSGSNPFTICSPIILGTGNGSFAYSGSIFDNNTKIRDSSSIAPYPRVDVTALGYGIASYVSPYHGQGSWNCNNWSTGSSSSFISRNSYNSSGSYTSSYCSASSRKKGHKLVQAVKQWHGREGFMCPTDECWQVSNRYLTVTRHTQYREGYFTGASGSYTGSLTVTFDATSERSYTVDRFSGAITMGSCLDTASVGTWNSTKAAIVQNSYNGLAMGMGCYDSASRAAMNYDNGWPEYGYIEYQSCSISETDIALHFETNYSNDYQEHITNVSLAGAYSSSVLYSDAINLLSFLPLNNDTITPWSTFGYRGFGPLLTMDEAPGPVSPDFGITDCTMYNGILYTGSGSQPADWEATHQSEWNQTGYTTGSKNCTYSGEILGRTINNISSSTLVTSSFDWQHVTWRWATVDGGITYAWFPTYYGAWSGQNVALYDTLDGIADTRWTQFTSNYWASYLPMGAYIIVPNGAGSIMVQKYEEIKEPIQSYNFARPCGVDRFQPDVSSGSCIGTGYSYPDILTNTDLTGYMGAGDYIYVDSGSITRVSVVDGVYSDHITEGTILYQDQSLFSTVRPRNFVAPLRWFPYNFRNTGICGRKMFTVDATKNTSGQPLTCSSADNNNHYLITGDTVYIYSNMTQNVSGGYRNITRVNSQSFAVGGTVWLPTIDQGRNFWVCHSSSLGIDANTLDYYNDKETKGDIVFVNAEPCGVATPNSGCNVINLGEDGLNFLGRYSASISGSSYGLSWTGSCVKYGPCGAYFGCSPNGDYHYGATTSSFRGMFPVSSCGSQWSCQGIQMVVDPLFQSSSICNTVSGDCSDYVEPITNTTSISMPSLPPDIYFDIPISGAVGLGKGASSMPNYQVPVPWSLDICVEEPI